jgi:ribosomal protein L37AE/L43A
MVHGPTRSHTPTVLLTDETDLMPRVACPLCHANGSLPESALAAGGAWQCDRCGQHWDAPRLTAVAAYAVWVADRPRADSGGAEGRPARVDDSR